MRFGPLLLIGQVHGLTLCAQSPSLFESIGSGVHYGGGIVCFLEDQIQDVLYMGGTSYYAGGVVSPGIFKWDGVEYHAVGCGFNWDCESQLGGVASPNPVFSLAMWNGELYAGGYLVTWSGEYQLNGIARWDGVQWNPLAGGLSLGQGNGVKRLRSMPDGLYVTGVFTHADDTLEVNGLARWDGEQWHKVYDLPKFSSGSSPNIINDVAWYDGKIWIGGNFAGSGVSDLAFYDGTEWTTVGNGLLGVFSTVNVLYVRDGLLYIGGSFADYPPHGHPDNPGSGIVAWDGEQWRDFAGGTRGSANAAVLDLHWIRDTLFVVGHFQLIGGVPTDRLAYWDHDAQRWCGLVPPNYFYPSIVALGSYRDTLVVGGSFVVAGPDSINRVARWVGQDYVDSCGVALGLDVDHAVGSNGLQVWPNPSSGLLHIDDGWQGGGVLLVYDGLGRVVHEQVLPIAGGGPLVLDLTAWAPGTYLARVLRNNGQVAMARFVRE